MFGGWGYWSQSIFSVTFDSCQHLTSFSFNRTSSPRGYCIFIVIICEYLQQEWKIINPFHLRVISRNPVTGKKVQYTPQSLICVYVCMYVCMYVCVCVCLFYFFLLICVCVCVCVCVLQSLVRSCAPLWLRIILSCQNW